MSELLRVYADEQGIWELYDYDEPVLFPWSQVVSVWGSAVEAASRRIVYVSLGLYDGQTLSMETDLDGFFPVADEMSRRLPGIEPDWLTTIHRLQPGDPAVVVWTAADA